MTVKVTDQMLIAACTVFYDGSWTFGEAEMMRVALTTALEEDERNRGVQTIVINPNLPMHTLEDAKQSLAALSWNAQFLDNVRDADDHHNKVERILARWPQLRKES